MTFLYFIVFQSVKKQEKNVRIQKVQEKPSRTEIVERRQNRRETKTKLEGGEADSDDAPPVWGALGLGRPSLSFFCFFIPSSLLHRTRTRPLSLSTPRRCGVRGWWPRRSRLARVWPPVPAAPPLSAAEFLQQEDKNRIKPSESGFWGLNSCFVWGIFHLF